VNIERRREYVNHYSFHIIDPQWGHVTIKMSGHPPFGAQIILNGHDYVARQATAAGIAFGKAGNCFTAVADPAGLARIADALSQHATVGRLGQDTIRGSRKITTNPVATGLPGPTPSTQRTPRQRRGRFGHRHGQSSSSSRRTRTAIDGFVLLETRPVA
jgi:hypothetical protein